MFTTPQLLITDDDRAFRQTVRSLFDARGFETHEASDGEEAVRIVREQEVHLVLMDFQMPRLTGIEAVRRLRAERENLPCILISGAVDEDVVAQAEEASVFSILRKPVSVVEIRNSVRTALFEVYGWTQAN
ncbi:MAG: response regulator [Planctomycetota bacterium]